MQFLWKYIDELVGKGLDSAIVAELLTYASATLVPMALPLAILLASIMTFGNLGEHYELVALKASGISLQRIMSPLIFVLITISIGAFFFSNNILPYTNLKMGALLYDIRHQRPELNIQEGIFYNGIENYSIKIDKKDKKTNTLYNLMIYDHTSKNGNINVIVADSGSMNMTPNDQYMILKLYNGYTYENVKEKKKRKEKKTYPFKRDKFEKETIIFTLSGFELSRTNENLFRDSYQMLNLNQLANKEDSLLRAFSKRKQTFSNILKKTHYFKSDKHFTKQDSLLTRLKKIDNIIFNLNHIFDSNNRAFVTDDLNIPIASNKKNKKLKTVDINTDKTTAISHITNLDSLLLGLSQAKKNKILTTSENFARSAKNYINSSKADIHARRKLIKKHQIEWHKKFTLPFACIVLFFIGAPLGAIIRKGGLGMPVVVSVVFFIFYYIITITGEKFVKEGVWPAFQGAWLATAILLPIGAFLTYKATTDSQIFNVDIYINIFKKIYSFIKPKSEAPNK